MSFVITSVKENHLQSTSVTTAEAGVEILEVCLKDGSSVLLILDGSHCSFTPDELRRLVTIELITRLLD